MWLNPQLLLPWPWLCSTSIFEILSDRAVSLPSQLQKKHLDDTLSIHLPNVSFSSTVCFKHFGIVSSFFQSSSDECIVLHKNWIAGCKSDLVLSHENMAFAAVV